jgi:hypothetical protein
MNKSSKEAQLDLTMTNVRDSPQFGGIGVPLRRTTAESWPSEHYCPIFSSCIRSHDQDARNNNIRHGFGQDSRQDRGAARGQHIFLSGILSAKNAAGEGRP